MKKVGIIIFVVAVILGITVANMFSWGRTSAKVLNFSINFGGVKGSGVTAVEKRDVSGFKSIKAGGAIEIEIVAQKEYSVEVEADDNLLQFVETKVSGSRLEISTSERLKMKKPVRVRISAPNIEAIDISGATKVSLSDVSNESLNVEASGASKVNVTGSSKKLIVELSGASRLDAENLQAVQASIDASGASSASVAVSEDLKADLSGASKVTYAGDPQLTKSTSGASKVSKR